MRRARVCCCAHTVRPAVTHSQSRCEEEGLMVGEEEESEGEEEGLLEREEEEGLVEGEEEEGETEGEKGGEIEGDADGGGEKDGVEEDVRKRKG